MSVFGNVFGKVLVHNWSTLNQNSIAPDGAILTEDGLFYLITEDSQYSLKQELED